MTPDALAAIEQSLSKSATELPTLDQGVAAAAQQQLNQQLIQKILGIGAVGLGVGAAGRGAVGLYNMARRNLQGSRAKPVGPVAVDVPVPVQKRADAASVLKDFFSGGSAKTLFGHPLAIPLGLAAGMGSTALGWKATDSVLDARRKQQLDDELAATREQFNQALLGQYDTPPAKRNLQQKVACALDDLYDTLQTTEKRGGLSDYMPDGNTAGWVTGGYLGAGGIAALLTAMGVYDSVRKGQPGAIMAAAQRQREQKLQATRPSQLFAVAAPAGGRGVSNPKSQLLSAANQDFTE